MPFHFPSRLSFALLGTKSQKLPSSCAPSNILAGLEVSSSGVGAGFISLALAAGIGLVICYFGLSETQQ